MTAQELVTDALREIGVLNAVESPSGEDATFALGKLNRILDNLNAERRSVYADTFASYTLVPGTNPHTIGPTGANWTVTQRPQSIEMANLVFGTDSRMAVTIRDAQWYLSQTSRELTSSLPSDLYYEPAYPNGKVWLWPEPSVGYDLELLTRIVLGSLTLASTFTMPPGYQDAVTLTLAEDLAGAFGVPATPHLMRKADAARGRVWGTTRVIPRLQTADAGMPGGLSGTWDYRTGMNR